MAAEVKTVNNWVGGISLPPANGEYMDVTSPATGKVIARVAVSSAADVNIAVQKAGEAQPAWAALTIKARAAKMMRLHALIEEHADELADLVVLEHGKTKAEALASVAKGNETVEYACSLPQLAQGKMLQVSRGVTCQDLREPVAQRGSCVVSIVPFNFPIMVAMWTTPIALTMGNTIVVKTSEKVPLTMMRVAELIKEAGVPDGVFSIINGTAEAVNALCDHPKVAAVTFVGSSRVAKLVHARCSALNKRVLALGGAKNHLVALNDCDVEQTAADIVSSFAGCAGQRCMAASVLLTVGHHQKLLDAVVERAKLLQPGQGSGFVMGPVIDAEARDRIVGYIDRAEQAGAKILLDGRSWTAREGSWVGPTVILHSSRTDEALHDEIFGPVISVLEVGSNEEALEIENASPYGNAACIYTRDGAAAEFFALRFRAGMCGVSCGVPVPREPYSFGGMYGTLSKFGDFDITGDGGMEFFSTRRKITTKWGNMPSSSMDKAQFF